MHLHFWPHFSCALQSRRNSGVLVGAQVSSGSGARLHLRPVCGLYCSKFFAPSCTGPGRKLGNDDAFPLGRRRRGFRARVRLDLLPDDHDLQRRHRCSGSRPTRGARHWWLCLPLRARGRAINRRLHEPGSLSRARSGGVVIRQPVALPGESGDRRGCWRCHLRRNTVRCPRHHPKGRSWLLLDGNEDHRGPVYETKITPQSEVEVNVLSKVGRLGRVSRPKNHTLAKRCSNAAAAKYDVGTALMAGSSRRAENTARRNTAARSAPLKPSVLATTLLRKASRVVSVTSTATRRHRISAIWRRPVVSGSGTGTMRLNRPGRMSSG
mmetsp:Transcript_3093/g.7984  ORF Transcript_3093/g.7984 Transcript_3093/m.7984 type:complete len:324 (+) Transcript_3093:150-1121(+)